MGAAKKLAYFVHVVDADGESHAFGPEDDVPGWAAKAITNPSAWGEEADGDPLAPPPAGPPATGQVNDSGSGKSVKDMNKTELQAEVDKRNEAREDEHKIVVGGNGNKADLVAALEADDSAAAGDE